MIWIGILVISMITLAVGLHKDECGIFGVFIWSLALVVGLILVFATMVLSSLFISKSSYIYEKTDTEEIVALQDSTGANGGLWFLGSCYVDNDLYYYYMTYTENGYKASKINAESTYVKYSDEAYIENYSSIDFKNKICYLFTIPLDSYYIAYIPEGSIIENYRIDLE